MMGRRISSGVTEHWAYSTSKSIHGPWHYEGRITAFRKFQRMKDGRIPKIDIQEK